MTKQQTEPVKNKPMFRVNVLIENQLEKKNIIIVEQEDETIDFIANDDQPILSLYLSDLEKAIKILKENPNA